MQTWFRQSMPRGDAWKRGVGTNLPQGAVLAVLLVLHPASALAHSGTPAPSIARHPAMPDLAHVPASADVRYVADWVAASGDNAGMPYIIIDKVDARVFVLDAGGHLQGVAPALLGMVAGDRSPQGIGDQKLSDIEPGQRITPAGRYVASLGRDLHGGEILWIDYASALALHRVVKGTVLERRAQRLASATPQDNRISYGCINVPVRFYDNVVSPAFTHSSGVVYILPEMSPARDMFRPGHPTADAPVHASAAP